MWKFSQISCSENLYIKDVDGLVNLEDAGIINPILAINFGRTVQLNLLRRHKGGLKRYTRDLQEIAPEFHAIKLHLTSGEGSRKKSYFFSGPGTKGGGG